MYGNAKKSPSPKVSYFYFQKNEKLWPHKVNSAGNFHDRQTGASCKSDCWRFRAPEGSKLGGKKEDDNGVPFYILLAPTMHCGGRNRCEKKWWRSDLCWSRGPSSISFGLSMGGEIIWSCLRYIPHRWVLVPPAQFNRSRRHETTDHDDCAEVRQKKLR